MKGINKVILVGHLGGDPEVRTTQGGNAMANLNVATSESWTDKNTHQKMEKTEWHKVVLFGKLAELAGQYLKKGSKVYLEGKLQTRKWQDQQGQDRYTTEVVLANGGQMQILDSRPQNGQQPYQPQQQSQPQQQQYQQSPQQNGQQQGYQAQHNAYAQASGGARPQVNNHQQQSQGGFDDFDDDIPF